MRITKVKEYENDWASKVDESRIHISKADSGKKGYFCLGCGEEMQAVKPKKDIQPYFRHDATNINRDKAKCVLASRIYREKIAKDYFFRTKEIKTPKIYKYPPNGESGQVYILNESSTFKANSLKSELTFYETEEGVIRWGSNPDIENRYNLLRPDLTFFDEDGKPQLLLEIVVTHKVDDFKKEKLRRLGIDCLQVVIPKKETIEIEKFLQKPSNFKWIYNELEASTDYIPVFNGNSEEISSIDEQQRKLLQESFNCRKSQINQLIRSITRCLRTESYRGVERHFRSEISRIENATINLRSRYEDEERALENEARESISSRIARVRKEQEQISSEQGRENIEYRNLETRYFTKKRQLEWEQRDIEQEQVNYGTAIEQERDYIKEHSTEREVREDIDRQEKELDKKFRKIEQRERQLIQELRERSGKPRSSAITKFREDIKRRENSILNYSRRRTNVAERRKAMENEKEGYDASRKSRYEEYRKYVLERTNKEDTSRDDELSRRIGAVLQIRGLSRDFEARRNLEQELKNLEK